MGKETPIAPETPWVLHDRGRIIVKPQRPANMTTPQGLPALRSPNAFSALNKDRAGWEQKVAQLREQITYLDGKPTRRTSFEPYATGTLDLGNGVQVVAHVSH